MSRTVRRALAVLGVIAAAVALVLVGRLTAGRPTASRPPAPELTSQDYFDGLRVGEAQGRQDGRALQEGSELPAAARQPTAAAFNAGYAAGTNDAFAGYDGGWNLGVPYLVTLEAGSGQIAYRIQSRVPVVAGVAYFLCANGHDVCQAPHH